MKLYTDTGFLSSRGEAAISMFLDKEIGYLLNEAKDENELRVIGSLLCKRVQDKVSQKVSNMKISNELCYKCNKEKIVDMGICHKCIKLIY